MRNMRWEMLLAEVLLVSLLAGPAAAQEDQALAVMKKHGLTRQGDYWVLEDEKRLREEMKRFDEVVNRVLPLKDQFREAIRKNSQRVRSRLGPLEAELKQVEQQLESPQLSSRGRRVLRAKRNRLRRDLESLERTTWWWEKRRQRGVPALNDIAKKYALERQKAAVYLRRIQLMSERSKNIYRALSTRPDVKRALQILGGKLGPTGNHAAKFYEMEPQLEEILDGPIPVFFEKGYFWSYIAVNEKTILVRLTERVWPRRGVLLTKQVARELGLQWDESPASSMSGRDDRGRSFSYQVTQTKLTMIMVGGFRIPNERCIVILDEVSDAPCVFSIGWLAKIERFGVYFHKDLLIVGVGFRPEKFGYEPIRRRGTSASRPGGRPGVGGLPPPPDPSSEPEVYVPL